MASNRCPLSVEALEDRLVLSTFPALNSLAGSVQRFTTSLLTVGYYNPLPPLDGFGTNFFNKANDPGFAISGFAGFSGAPGNTGQTNQNLLGFGPADPGIPGMTATAGPTNFSQSPTTTTGQTAATAQALALAQAQAQALAVAQLFEARLLLTQQLLFIAAARAAATQSPALTLAGQSAAALLASQNFAAQLQATRFAATAPTPQSGLMPPTNAGLLGTGTINLAALNAGNTSTTGAFANGGTGLSNAALPTTGFSVAATPGFTALPTTQSTSTALTGLPSSLRDFNTGLAASGFGSAF